MSSTQYSQQLLSPLGLLDYRFEAKWGLGRSWQQQLYGQSGAGSMGAGV